MIELGFWWNGFEIMAGWAQENQVDLITTFEKAASKPKNSLLSSSTVKVRKDKAYSHGMLPTVLARYILRTLGEESGRTEAGS